MNGSYLALVQPRSQLRPRRRYIRIRLKKRVTRIFHWVKGRVSRALTRFCAKLRSRFLCRVGLGSGYVRVGAEEEDRFWMAPKGHLTVYVGRAAEVERVVLPVIYLNHPLFRKLLEEAREKYGFDHPGGITIPCPVSEFEKVKSKIEAGRTSSAC